VTIFLTTQYLDEADELADQIAVLDTVASSLRAVPTSSSSGSLASCAARVRDANALELAGGLLPRCHAEDGRLVLRCQMTAAFRRCGALLAELDERQIEVERLSMHTPDLDDVFFRRHRSSDDRRGGTGGMSALSYTVTDSTILLQRNLRRLQRYPSLTLMLVGMRSCSCCCSCTCSAANSVVD